MFKGFTFPHYCCAMLSHDLFPIKHSLFSSLVLHLSPSPSVSHRSVGQCYSHAVLTVGYYGMLFCVQCHAKLMLFALWFCSANLMLFCFLGCSHAILIIAICSCFFVVGYLFNIYGMICLLSEHLNAQPMMIQPMVASKEILFQVARLRNVLPQSEVVR